MTETPIAPSAFPGWVATPGCAPCPCWGALDSSPPPCGALSLTPAHFLDEVWGSDSGSLPTTAATAAKVLMKWLRLPPCRSCHAAAYPVRLLWCTSKNCSAARGCTLELASADSCIYQERGYARGGGGDLPWEAKIHPVGGGGGASVAVGKNHKKS